MNTCNFFVYRLFVDFICADFFKYDYSSFASTQIISLVSNKNGLVKKLIK